MSSLGTLNTFIAILKSLSCASAIALLRTYSGLLVANGDLLSWLLVNVFLFWCIGICVWDDCNSNADIWSCLYWVGILFLGFCCPLRFLDCGACG